MKRIAALLLCMLVLPAAWAAPEMARALPAGQIAGPPPLDPADPAWARAPATRVALYPQSTAPGGPGGGVLEMEARVLQGNGHLALRLAWPDATADVADAKSTDRFADAAAVQFAPAGATGPGCAPVGAGLPAITRLEIAGKPAPTDAAPACRIDTLPYIGMGEPGRPVRVWFWRAGRPAEHMSARGFGSLAKQAGEPPEAQARRVAAGWEVVLRGEMGSSLAAFAAWDGAEDGRAGRKRLSAWRALGPLDAALTEEARAVGDPASGKRLYAEHGCAACHAPGVGLGPDLSHAGGIHWPGYLRRALREPAAFVVPGYAAIMPAPPVRPEALEDLVAYLMTLK